MTKIINNNLWSPVPWGWGCNGCDGGNNWLNKMLGYQMLFGMMNNMSNWFAPQQRQQTQQTYNPYYGSIYPGLSLGATQGNTSTSYEDYMDRMQAQNDLAQMKQTWNEFKISNIGGKYQAILKNDKTVILNGDTTDELNSNIIAYVQENPAQFKAKEKEGAGGLDESGNGNEAAAGNDTGDGNVAGAGDGNAAGAGTGTGAGDGAGNGNVSGARSFKRATLDNNKYHWSTYKQLDHNSKKLFEVGMTAEQVLYKSIPAAKNWSQEDKDKYIQYIKDVNPTAIDKDGKVVNLDKLDLILVNQKSKEKTTRPNFGKYHSGKLELYTGYTFDTNYIKWNNNNMIYKGGNGYSADADLVLLIDGNHYKINGEDFYKALGLRDDSIWSQMAGGNSNIIDSKTGQFKTNGTWPANGFILSCVKEGNKDTSNLKGSKLTVENGKVVLIVGKNRFLMDKVMNGTIPCKQINGAKGNQYAE